jgi:hypothetical protein
MIETATGIVRIAALVMLMTVFGVVWRGDQQSQQQFVIARKAAAEQQSMLAQRSADRETAPPLRAAAPIRPETSQPTAAASTKGDAGTPTTLSRIARVEVEMELPAGIAPGTYQIVEKTGRMQKVRITATDHPVSERDLYVLDPQDGQRRYFIRISDAPALPHERTASAPTPARR